MTESARVAERFPPIRLSSMARRFFHELVSATGAEQVLVLTSRCSSPAAQVTVATAGGHSVWADVEQLRACPTGGSTVLSAWGLPHMRLARHDRAYPRGRRPVETARAADPSPPDRDKGGHMTVEGLQTTTWTIDRIRVTLRHSDPESVQVTIDIPRGGVAPETRRRVVDDIVCSRELRGAHVVQMTIPLGDVDVLDELRKELEVVGTRPAGASCLVDARPKQLMR